MTDSFRVRVSKDYTIFAAGHFVSYDGDQVEPLHGHNYRAAVGVEGPLDENNYVFNFVPLKRALRAICDSLDHRLLLPTNNPLIHIERDDTAYTVKVYQKTYVFPAEDVIQLPIPNTTAECLATWISGQLVKQLEARGESLAGVTAIEVEVEETFGQCAVCRRELGAS